jgi:hypothetical protein
VSKLPVPTAKEINDAHAYAKECAETAVEHAIKCGKLLERKKKELGHGKFGEWVKTYCDFAYSTAARYLKAAQISTVVEISTLGQIYPPKPKAKLEQPKTLTGAADAGVVAEPAATAPAEPPPVAQVPSATKPEAVPEVSTEPEWTPADEAAANAEAEADERERVGAAMASDDKLAAAFEQIKQQAALLSVANAARNRAMNQAAEAVRLLKAEQRKVSRLERELDKLRGKKAA